MALWFFSSLRPASPPSDEATSYFGQDFLARSRRRATLAYLDSGLSTVATFVMVYAMARIGAGRLPLPAALRGEVGPWKAALLGFVVGAAAILVVQAVNLPFGIYGLYLDRTYGLSRMTLAAYLIDYAKSSLMGEIAYSFGGGFVALVLNRFPRTWHFVITGAFLLASLVLSALYPTLIAPFFDKFHPLEPGPVLSAVEGLAADAGMKVDKVLVMEASAKTSASNAYFTGIGRTRQVVLYDTLLASNSLEDVRLVVAHELGHWKMGHVVKEVIASAVGSLAILWLMRLAVWPPGGLRGSRADAAGMAHLLLVMLLFMTLASYVLSPASNYISRAFEADADAFSIRLTGDRAAFVSSQVNLAKQNLADVEPPAFLRWFAWTHPTTMERVRSASQVR